MKKKKFAKIIFRAIQPEAVIWIDGAKYNIGGLNTHNISRAYLNRTALWESAQADKNALKFVKYETGSITPRFPYTPGR